MTRAIDLLCFYLEAKRFQSFTFMKIVINRLKTLTQVPTTFPWTFVLKKHL